MVALSFERYVDLLVCPAVLFRGQPYRVRRQATLSLDQQRRVELSLLPPITPADRHAFVVLQVIEPLPPLQLRPLRRWDRLVLLAERKQRPMNGVELQDLFGQVHAVMLRDLEKERKYLEAKFGRQETKKGKPFDIGRWLAGLMDRFGGKPTEWEQLPRYLVEAAVEGMNAIHKEQAGKAVKTKPEREKPVTTDEPEKFFSALGIPVPKDVTLRPIPIDPDKIMPMAQPEDWKQQPTREEEQPRPRAPRPRQRPEPPGSINRRMRQGLTGR